ncbi:MAG: Fe-S cluster assembly protein SufD [Barnesiella sp.]|nr:Fe-S cluster assembly protein SufD [Barnesiella sp.]
MNSLDQYIELYLEHRDIVDSHSAPALNRLRHEALEVLERSRLPHKGDEGYERTSVDDMFAPDFGVNISRMPVEADLAATFKCDVPNMSTLLGITLNDTFHPSATLVKRLPEGVIFTSLREAAEKHPELVEHYYGSLAPLTEAAVALNTLLAQDGVMIYVPRGMKLDRPLQLVNIFCSREPVMAVRRVLVVIEEGAEAQILVCDHTQPEAGASLSSQVVEIAVGRNARLDYCDMEESTSATSRHSRMFVRQEADSYLNLNGITLSCGNTRNDYSIDLTAPGCETRLSGMVIGSDRRHADNNSVVRHLAPRCKSNQLFKYVLDDDSTGAFEGSILVAPGAQHTEAYQSNRNILAAPGARMHTRPQLEIYNDDVKCSHGATTGQLDDEALFYMRTRGIPEREARVMLMQAFMTDVIDSVGIEGLRDRLRHLVERRFAGVSATCGDCPVNS